MEIENTFKRRLRDSEELAGLWLQLASNLAAEALAYSGFDWFLIDAEHAPNEVSDVISQMQAIAAGSSSPIVRPSVNEPVLIKRLLDAGVQSLLLPNVNSAEEAAAAVRAVRYPPHGIRGVATCSRGNRFGHVPDYFKRANDEMCVIVQIETSAAVEHVREIGSVDGVDALFIGPFDLATNMGQLVNPTHPEVNVAIQTVLDVAKSIGKPVGTVSFGPGDARKKFDMGFRFVSVASELPAMIRACEEQLAAARIR